MTDRERRLVELLRETRETLHAAMRTIADLDDDVASGLSLEGRFVAEAHRAGVRDGLGARVTAILNECEAES